MHEIRYLTMSGRFGENRVYEEANKIHKRCCEYNNSLERLRFPKVVLKNEAEAIQYIESHDNGWYDNIAVKYKDKTRTMWKVKIEYHV